MYFKNFEHSMNINDLCFGVIREKSYLLTVNNGSKSWKLIFSKSDCLYSSSRMTYLCFQMTKPHRSLHSCFLVATYFWKTRYFPDDWKSRKVFISFARFMIEFLSLKVSLILSKKYTGYLGPSKQNQINCFSTIF